ncbi:MAG: sugar-binding transcriptional regulator [Puniceicoccaceae bacterium]|nr:MAG: sugar-binding transcriptional regulator [Puniceicoccaceae bacterium]
MPPAGCFPELEERLCRLHGLEGAVVADSGGRDGGVEPALGGAGVALVEALLRPGEVVGLSSWSRSLLELVRAMHPLRERPGIRVVQILGGVGNPAAEVHANHLTARLSSLLGAEAHFLSAPGVAASPELRAAYLKDPYTRATMDLFPKLTLALVGIGALQPSDLISKSGNILGEEELAWLRKQGAVGDVCLGFFDREGVPVEGAWKERICALSLEQLRSVPRRVALAGGTVKRKAILGALRGGWLTHLVTDDRTARWLVKEGKARR